MVLVIAGKWWVEWFYQVIANGKPIDIKTLNELWPTIATGSGRYTPNGRINRHPSGTKMKPMQ